MDASFHLKSSLRSHFNNMSTLTPAHTHLQTLITKADGEQEAFDPAKLEHSLQLAGATSTVRAKILARIVQGLKPAMNTETIYHSAFEMLKREEQPPVAARYSVKRAVFSLGPSGYPFEQFFAEVLRGHGWHTQTGVTLNGRC